MNTTVRIGILGCSLESVNYGVSALAYTQIAVLEKIAKKCSFGFEYWIFSDDTETVINDARRQLDCGVIVSKPVIRSSDGLKGLSQIKNEISQCDLVIDLTYGDSFSDIYGIKNYLRFCIPKIICIRSGKPLVLGPQTYGPYSSKISQVLAKYILRHADVLIARDKLSGTVAQSISKRSDVLLTSDLAMALPYDSGKYKLEKKGEPIAGLNVSALLWTKNAANSTTSVSLKLSYRDLIERLIGTMQQEGYIVHLIGHVFTHDEQSEDALNEKIHQMFPNTVVAPKFTDVMDAKSYLSQMDVFLGARMHATIGAFSSGVPVIPMAYSRKFLGLYSTIGYPYVVDCTGGSVDSIVANIMEILKNLDALKTAAKAAFFRAKELNEAYSLQLEKIIAKNIEAK